MSRLVVVEPPPVLYRIGRKPDPWAWPPWEYCRKANRWDDPTDNFRVLYGATQRRATFIETLARFRPDPAVVAGLQQIVGDDEGALPPGHVPTSWVSARAMGTATVEGRFADVGHSESLAYLQMSMASRLIHYGVRELDGAVIRAAQREFTQEISLHVFSQASATGDPIFAGIAYESRLGNEFMNWAIFERADQDPVRNIAVADIRLDDPDFTGTLALFDLKLAGGR